MPKRAADVITPFRSVAVGLPLDCAVLPDNLRLLLGSQGRRAWHGARHRIPTSPGRPGMRGRTVRLERLSRASARADHFDRPAVPREALLQGLTGSAAQFDDISPADRDWEPPLGVGLGS